PLGFVVVLGVRIGELERAALSQNLTKYVRTLQRGVGSYQTAQTVAAQYRTVGIERDAEFALDPRHQIVAQELDERIAEVHVKRASLTAVIDEYGNRRPDLTFREEIVEDRCRGDATLVCRI